MDLNEFIFEMAEGMIDELRDSPAGKALRNLLRPPPRPRGSARRMNPAPGPRAARPRAAKKARARAEPSTPAPTAKQIAIAACTIAHYSGRNPADLIESPDLLKQAAREAFRKTHPDVGGNPEDFKKVIAAKEVLKIV